MCMCSYSVFMRVGVGVLCACDNQKKAIRLPEVGVEGCQTWWVLGTETVSSGRAPSALTCWTISPDGLSQMKANFIWLRPHWLQEFRKDFSKVTNCNSIVDFFLANTDRALGLIFSFKRKQIASQHLGCKGRQMDLWVELHLNSDTSLKTAKRDKSNFTISPVYHSFTYCQTPELFLTFCNNLLTMTSMDKPL